LKDFNSQTKTNTLHRGVVETRILLGHRTQPVLNIRSLAGWLAGWIQSIEWRFWWTRERDRKYLHSNERTNEREIFHLSRHVMLSSQTTTDDVEQQGTITITTPRTTTIPLEESPDLLALAASSSSSSSMIPSTSAAAAATTTTSLWRMKLFGGRNTPNHPPRTVGLGTDEEEEEDDLDRINHTTTTTTTTTTSPNKNTSCRSDCPICLEEFDDEDDPERQPDDDEENQRTIRRTTIPECQHEFCQECLRTYCEHCIQIRKVPIPCPQQQQSSSPPTNPCPIRLTHETVQTVLLSSCSNNNDNNTNSNVCQNVMDGTTQIDYGTILDETTQNTNHQQQRNHHDDDNDIVDETTNHAIMMKAWQRYWKLIRLSQDSNLWECPHCNELVNIHRPLRSRTAAVSADDENHPNTHVDQDDEHEEEEEENDWSCSHCRGSFCKIHSLAHAGFTCREFRQTQAARAWEQTEEALKQYTQPCSHCGSYIQKYKGCDHVICLHCHSDMCWKVRRIDFFLVVVVVA
jgi:hypothetical protein